MSAQSLKEISTKWVAAYNSRDPEAAIALYDEDVTNVQLPWGIPSRAGMRATYQRIFQAFPDIHIEVENTLVDDPWVVVEWRFTGTMRGEFAGHPANYRNFDMRGCEVFRVIEGKIQTQHGYWDKATMFGQLGIDLSS